LTRLALLAPFFKLVTQAKSRQIDFFERIPNNVNLRVFLCFVTSNVSKPFLRQDMDLIFNFTMR